MVRNTVTPFTRNGFEFEPSLDRIVGRALAMPFPGDGSEVHELQDRAEIRLDVPGVKPEQLAVNVEHRTLIVKVERDGRGAFTRQFTVGPSYDLSAVQARLELGVLTLTVPKAAEAQPRSIAVQVG
jgi:HSP20 family molecular chaperone IbpA